MRPSPRLLAMHVLAVLVGGGVASAERAWMGSTVWIAPDVYTGASTAPRDAALAHAAFDDAVAAAEAGDAMAAFASAAEALHHNPDHAAARRALGYVHDGDAWRTPYEAKQAADGKSWHASYGWVKPTEVARLEAGERRIGRRWVSAEAAARRHSDIERGWRVRTDSFVVTTNHSLEAAARLAAELEGVAQLWRQRFADYWLDPYEPTQRFVTGGAGTVGESSTQRPMRVFHHRDRDGYVRHLRRRLPGVERSLGAYLDVARESHFFESGEAGEEAAGVGPAATRRHEIAHQLFAERGPGGAGAGRDAGQWLIEGVACYLELFAPSPDRPASYTFGHPAQGRLPSAVAYGPAMPLAELARLSQAELLRVENLPRAYAQATGVVTLLRHGPNAATDGPALSRTLRAVYGDRPDGDELARQVGRSYDELDREYARFLANLSR